VTELGDLEIFRGVLAAIFHKVIFDNLIFVEGREPGTLDRGDMDEDVLAAVIADDEAKTLLRVEEFDDALAFADDLGGHSATAAAAAAPKAAASSASSTAAETAAAAATAIAERRPVAKTASPAAAAAALLKSDLIAEIFFAEDIVALIATAPTAVPLAPSIETHEPSVFLMPAYPKKPTRSGLMAQLVAARNHSRTVHALTLK
jgi:hypothetical protein